MHPAPDLAGLSLEQALAAQYAFYDEHQRVLGHIYRDAEVMPALAQVLSSVREVFAQRVGELVGGLGLRGKRRDQATALVALSLEFTTWRSLDRSGLAGADAAALMARLIRPI